MCMEKHFDQKPELKRQSMEWKHTDSLVKKKVPGTTVSKEGHHADSVLGHKMTHHY